MSQFTHAVYTQCNEHDYGYEFVVSFSFSNVYKGAMPKYATGCM